jgi:Fungal specific transcription factor domain/Fungal Zn(2)-Cys(6) binuclear cluster domain
MSQSKCDSKLPSCSTCIAYKDDCVYDKSPSLAYVRSLEEEIAELKQQLRQQKTQTWLSKVGAYFQRLQAMLIQKTTSNEDRKLSSATSPASQGSRESYTDGTPLPLRAPRQVKWETDISIDDEGSVTFHNSTSAVHQPPSKVHGVQMPLAQARALPNGPDAELARRTLVSNATTQRQWEDYAIANASVKVNVATEVSHELLKYHWCWVHPLFLFVYRPAFVHGMSLVNSATTPTGLDPPYFSDTLLKVIHAHAARFLNHTVHRQSYQTLLNQELSAAEFMDKLTEEAQISLGLETLKRGSIPTIQALLQQSARENNFGRSSQSWLYSGMAFRMAFDIGIHLPSDKLQVFVKSLSPEDIEIRKRLFWSCYTWDKIISLYLGRMPAFTPATDDVPLDFMDDYSDTDLWAPYYGETPANGTASNYVPRPGYVVSCFRQLCKLCIILNDLMQGIYSSSAQPTRTHEDTEAGTSESSFIKISRDLREFWLSLPEHLRVDPNHVPGVAPPPHIMSLNLLYYTTLILLHRPLIMISAGDLGQPAAQKSYATCVSATAAIHDLLVLQGNTFGLNHVSYLNAYCAYIAATIAVLRFEREYRPGEDYQTSTQALGLNFLLEVLQRTANAMSSLERSVAIIRKRMKAVLERQATNQLNSLFPVSTPVHFEMSTAQHHTQPALFQTMSHPAIPDMYSGPEQQPSIPMQSLSESRATLYAEQSYSEVDFLPAFPGHQFPIGSDHSFGPNEEAKSGLMRFNLDPYPRFTSDEIDRNFVDAFMNEPQAMSTT